MMTLRKSALILVCLIGVSLASPAEAEAQRWLQTSQLIVPVENDAPTRALLDTLVQVIERKDSLMVRRSPESTEQMSLSDLRNQLISGPGIGLSSASHVFIDYEFMIGNRGFEENIKAFQFLFRPPGQGQEDVQMLHVDASQSWVEEILKNKGTTLRTNQAALKTFSDQLAFARMQDNEGAQVVEIAGQAVREGFEAKKRKLVEKITRLTYESM
jgi:hypothetical protein